MNDCEKRKLEMFVRVRNFAGDIAPNSVAQKLFRKAIGGSKDVVMPIALSMVDKYRTGSGPGSPCGQPAWGGGSDWGLPSVC